jgi:hypothetical protein
MNTENMEVFLKEISKRHPQDYICMVMDQAPCHTAKKINIPDNIGFLELPPYSPQLNPVENLWEEMREKFFDNHTFSSMDDVEDRMCEAILNFENSTDKMKSITAWDWIIKGLE